MKIVLNIFKLYNEVVHNSEMSVCEPVLPSINYSGSCVVWASSNSPPDLVLGHDMDFL